MAGPHIKFVAYHEDQISQHKYHILQGKHNLAPFTIHLFLLIFNCCQGFWKGKILIKLKCTKQLLRYVYVFINDFIFNLFIWTSNNFKQKNGTKNN